MRPKKRRLARNLAQRNEERGLSRRSAAEDRCYSANYKNITAPTREVAMEPKRRQLAWVERPNFQGWACSECEWVFNPSSPIAGNSIEEMKAKFGQERDKEFASHVCAEHPKARKDHQ